MSRRFKDFDKFIEETERKLEPVIFQYGGEEFRLPPNLPAIIPIKAMRLKKEYGSDDEIPADETVTLALDIFGKEQLDRLLAKQISMDTLSEIIKWVFEQYNADVGATDGEPGNPAAPEVTGAQWKSSKTGGQ